MCAPGHTPRSKLQALPLQFPVWSLCLSTQLSFLVTILNIKAESV